MADATGLTTYTYDARDRLLTKAAPQGALTYTYDRLGNLKTVRSSNPNGVSVDYGYDELSRLSSVTDNRQAANNVTSYSYDKAGNLESYSYGNGVKSAYTYNTLNRLTNLTISKATSMVNSYAYTLGAAGERQSVTEADGRSVSYTYDALYRLKGETVAGDAGGVNGSVTYTYDDAGNRLSRASSLPGVGAQSSTYDKNDRLTSDTYDANGNTKQSSGSAYAYDFENRLASVNNGSVTYLYDGDGNRVSKTVGGVTTTYLVDTNNPTGYAQVVEELRGGQVFRQYAYGTDLISQRQIINNQWVVSYYGYDGHGSVRFLTDQAGAVTDSYTYDAFGTLIEQSGATPNEYLFAGERYDSETGMYYLRARYMRPETGRFWTMDSFEGRSHDPQSLHKYIYANADGVNRIDPSGHETSLAELNVTLSIGNILAAEASLTLGTAEAALTAEFVGETALAATAEAAGVSASGSALTSVLTFLGTAAAGTILATSGSGSDSDSDKKEEQEIFYRVMTKQMYAGLGPRGEISIIGTENFVTQSPDYISGFVATHPDTCQVLVVYLMQKGTKDALTASGATSPSAVNLDPSLARLRSIATYPKNEPNVVHIKGERGALTYGLRRGTVGIFNSRIIASQGYEL